MNQTKLIGADCGHSGVHRCKGLTKCRLTIRNKPGQRLIEYLTDAEQERLKTIAFTTGPCSGCGEVIKDELDFAAHFVIPDMKFPGLGNCPNKETVFWQPETKETVK